MRTVGISYAFWGHEWDVDFVPIVSKVKKLGYNQLEVNGITLEKMSAWGRKRLSYEARDQQLDLTYGAMLSSGYDVSSLDEEIRKAGVAFMVEMIKAVGSMGGGSIGGIIHSSVLSKLGKGEDKRRYFDQSVKSMRFLVKVAEDNDVMLNIGVSNRYEQFLLNTCPEALQYIHAVNHPNCGILLDTFHMNIEEDNMGDAIRMAGLYLHCLHLSETNRKPAGLGRQSWAEIRLALDDIYYDGPLVQNPFILSGGQVGHDACVWRELLEHPNLDELAKTSCLFIREHLI
ncbi:MAG: sugar phosphate isomerase/epimerase family protein [Sphaerochaeta sp.]|nr:sugar phosphate isomerase/epimerase [Sphaerochaeta sp.]